MDALILSCSTGGGHNAAGAAIRDELEARGHHVTMMDPYELVSHKLAEEIGNVYVKMVQRSPKLFGVVYALGGMVRRVPGKSPVYYANIAVAKKLKEYLDENPVDVILMPHLYPAELITYLKRQGDKLPLTVFVATDYVCIPFTEETDCDYYVVSGERQMREFTRWRIPKEKLLPYGIPVGRAFDEPVTKQEARLRLGLDVDENKKYILLTGGSIGAGDIHKNIRILLNYMKKNNVDGKLIVVCGNNERLYRQLEKEYVNTGSWKYKLKSYARKRGKASHMWDEENRVILLKKTRQMALYMRACDIFISKPGGLSSTEAAVAQVPYIHIRPIPGCETHNMRFFTRNGMSIGVRHPRLQLASAVGKLSKEDQITKMKQHQQEGITQNARKGLCDWLEERVRE